LVPTRNYPTHEARRASDHSYSGGSSFGQGGYDVALIRADASTRGVYIAGRWSHWSVESLKHVTLVSDVVGPAEVADASSPRSINPLLPSSTNVDRAGQRVTLFGRCARQRKLPVYRRQVRFPSSRRIHTVLGIARLTARACHPHTSSSTRRSYESSVQFIAAERGRAKSFWSNQPVDNPPHSTSFRITLLNSSVPATPRYVYCVTAHRFGRTSRHRLYRNHRSFSALQTHEGIPGRGSIPFQPPIRRAYIADGRTSIKGVPNPQSRPI